MDDTAFCIFLGLGRIDDDSRSVICCRKLREEEAFAQSQEPGTITQSPFPTRVKPSLFLSLNTAGIWSSAERGYQKTICRSQQWSSCLRVSCSHCGSFGVSQKFSGPGGIAVHPWHLWMREKLRNSVGILREERRGGHLAAAAAWELAAAVFKVSSSSF